MDLERKLQDELKSIDLETLAVMDGQVEPHYFNKF